MLRRAGALCAALAIAGCGASESASVDCNDPTTALQVPACMDRSMFASGTFLCDAFVRRASPAERRRARRVPRPPKKSRLSGEPLRLAPSPHVEIRDGQVVRPREIEAAIGETAFIPVITDRCETPIETPTGPATLHYGANTISFQLVEPGERQVRLAETGEPMVTVRAVEAD